MITNNSITIFKMKKKYFLLISLSLLTLACQDSNHENGLVEDSPEMTPPKSVAAKDSANRGLTDDYINTDRVIWQKPDMVINMLGDLENKTVADIGAGTGYFSLRLAAQSKKVIAVDIDPRFTSYLDSIKILELPESFQDRLETRLTTPEEPGLQESEVDIVVIVNTYMYLSDRVRYLKTLHQSIAEGGKLLIVDFKKKRTPIGPPSPIRIPLYQVEEELYEAGYSNVKTYDTALDYQYIVLADR